jgi:hypothetical protein
MIVLENKGGSYPRMYRLALICVRIVWVIFVMIQPFFRMQEIDSLCTEIVLFAYEKLKVK